MPRLDKMSTWHLVGRGIHGSVWRARENPPIPTPSSTGALDTVPINPLNDIPNWIAVKVVDDNKSIPPHDIEREAAILKELSHPNVISLLSFEHGGFRAPFALQMPLIPLPLSALLSSPLFTPSPLTGPYSALARPVLTSCLLDEINAFEVVARSIIYQLLLAITYIHSQEPPIAHRDINPGNVLIDSQGFVKLVDFGIAWNQPQNGGEMLSSARSAANIFSGDWKETPEDMCCQVATGPHRAPELLFSPRRYSTRAIDLWALGTSIAQFFTPLQLIPSSFPVLYTGVDENPLETVDVPFMVPQILQKSIDYQARWERRTLFEGERGELGLAWSIFKIRGTPTEETWPEFFSLPDTGSVEFQKASRQPLHTVLPNLPSTGYSSPESLIDALLAYRIKERIPAGEALNHPWFSSELLLPETHPGRTNENLPSRITTWEGRSLSEWLEPALKREANRVTRVES